MEYIKNSLLNANVFCLLLWRRTFFTIKGSNDRHISEHKKTNFNIIYLNTRMLKGHHFKKLVLRKLIKTVSFLPTLTNRLEILVRGTIPDAPPKYGVHLTPLSWATEWERNGMNPFWLENEQKQCKINRKKQPSFFSYLRLL